MFNSANPNCCDQDTQDSEACCSWLLNRNLVYLLVAAMVALGNFEAVAQTTAESTSPAASAQSNSQSQSKTASSQEFDWTQWRGSNRDGILPEGQTLPDKLSADVLKKVWSLDLEPSYSGALAVGDRVFVTETQGKKEEAVTALDRSNGKVIWSVKWPGAMSVPFFANANGSWIRSTPAYSDGKLYVAGMLDVLICLDANDGKEIWKIDFPKQKGSAKQSFGFVCSPLVDEGFVYVHTGGGLVKLNKDTGEIAWQVLNEGGGMNGGAFSSPIITTVAGRRQAVVQTRTSLCGIALEDGQQLWSIKVPTFRGMNILTPAVTGDQVFTSTYGGTTQLVNVSTSGGGFSTSQVWNKPAEGYMSSPVIVKGHAYVHLRNTRFACFDLKTGQEMWRSGPYGKYSSLVATEDKILALDESGELLLFKASPESFSLIDSRKVGNNSWAHVAVSGKQIIVRNLKEVVLYEW